MLKIRHQQKRLPLGGHHFNEGLVTLKGDTHIEVANKLRDFRVNNNKPMGDPEQDVLNYYAETSPWMVREDEEKEEVPLDPSYLEWRDWVYRVWDKPPKKYTTKRDATARWLVCKTCPFNKKMDWVESNESSELVRRAFLLRKGLEVPDYLGFCTCHKADLGAFSFLEAPKDHSGIAKDAKNYPSCWV